MDDTVGLFRFAFCPESGIARSSLILQAWIHPLALANFLMSGMMSRKSLALIFFALVPTLHVVIRI